MNYIGKTPKTIVPAQASRCRLVYYHDGLGHSISFFSKIILYLRQTQIEYMKTIKINDIIDRALRGEIVHKLTLLDASRYASNARGPMSVNTTIFYSSRVSEVEPGDRVLSIGKKYYNVDELRRCLEAFSDKGNVSIWIGQETLCGNLTNF